MMNRLVRIGPFVYAFILILGSMIPGCSESNDRRVDNLSAFARLYGYVKYFHPSDESASLDWDNFLVYGVEAVIGATRSEVLHQRLEQLFLPIAPTVQISVGKLPAIYRSALSADPMEGTHVVAWQHVSSYFSARIGRDSVLHDLYPFVDDYPQVGEVYEADLGFNLRARIPLALLADSVSTYPRGKAESLSAMMDSALSDYTDVWIV